MHKIEIFIALILSAYVSTVLGLSATFAMFAGWIFANAFHYFENESKKKQQKNIDLKK
jgi:Na+/H+ antiporter NhaC